MKRNSDAHVANAAHGHSEDHSGGHVHRDDIGSKMGIWLFLFTELLLFGGMFILYAAYRFIYPDDFKSAALELDPVLGAVNTIVLLTSSLTVVLAIVALQKKNIKLCMTNLWITQFCGVIFLVNKYFEWTHKIHLGIYPKGPALEEMTQGQTVFFGLYYVMTGLHGLHVIVGMAFIGFIMYFIKKNYITYNNYQKLENSGLYWHLVDVIWIFLFPLFYLIH